MDHHSQAPAPQALLFLAPITLLTTLWVLCRILPYDLSAGVWLLSLLVLGMPHGAMDIVILRQQAHNSSPFWKKIASYLLLMLGAWASLMLAPMLTVLAFLVLTAIHFGEADRTAFTAFFSDSPSFPKSWAWLRGSLVITIPCSLHPDQSWLPFAQLTHIPTTAHTQQTLQWFALALFVLASCSAVTSLIRSPQTIRSRGFLFFCLETLVAIAWFLSTPPLLAIGGYFLCIHASRHMLRLMDQFYRKTPKPLASKQLTMHLDSLAFAIPALLCILLWSSTLDTPSLSHRIAYASIGFYLISTLPHHLLTRKLPTTA